MWVISHICSITQLWRWMLDVIEMILEQCFPCVMKIWIILFHVCAVCSSLANTALIWWSVCPDYICDNGEDWRWRTPGSQHLGGGPGGSHKVCLKLSWIFEFHQSCHFRLSDILTGLKEDGIEPQKLLDNLEYVQDALEYLVLELQ